MLLKISNRRRASEMREIVPKTTTQIFGAHLLSNNIHIALTHTITGTSSLFVGLGVAPPLSRCACRCAKVLVFILKATPPATCLTNLIKLPERSCIHRFP